jgi:hypothetical protein
MGVDREALSAIARKIGRQIMMINESIYPFRATATLTANTWMAAGDFLRYLGQVSVLFHCSD